MSTIKPDPTTGPDQASTPSPAADPVVQDSAEAQGVAAGAVDAPVPPERLGLVGNLLWRVLPYGSIAACLFIYFGPPTSPETVGVTALIMMLVLMAIKVPIGIALVVPAVLGIYSLQGSIVTEGALQTTAYLNVASWTLSVIPMFVLMGLLLVRSGLATTIYAAMEALVGRIPGSLAVGTNIAGGGLGAVTGDSMSTTYALARAGIPEMLKAGYDRRYAVGSVIMTGMSGQLIPPSILLVIYAGIAGTPMGPQLMAGVVPGLLVVVVCCLALIALAVARPSLVGGRGEKGVRTMSASERVKAVAASWPIWALMVVIFGSIYSGMFTVTEAGAVAAVFTVLLTFWAVPFKQATGMVKTAVIETVSVTSSIFLLVIGAVLFTRLLAISGIAPQLTEIIIDFDLSRVQLLLVLVVVYTLLGMFMNTLAVILLTVPLLTPVLLELDVSMVWFGVFIVLMVEVGMVTPPVGILTFILHGIVQDPEVNRGQKISLGDVFQGVAWILPVVLVVLIILILWPDLALWLPERAYG